MDLVQLEIFKAVAEHGSISAAATQIHRVPSNLTTRIKQLEQDLGVDLFIREKSRLRLCELMYDPLNLLKEFLFLCPHLCQFIVQRRQTHLFIHDCILSLGNIFCTQFSVRCCPK